MSRKNQWKSEHERLKDEKCSVPAGCASLEQIAEEVGLSEENTRKDVILPLIKAGRAEEVPGFRRNSSGAVIKAVFYRLIGSEESA